MDFNGTLANGVELYTHINAALPDFCLRLLVRQGAAQEPREHHGLAHFLEHALFRAISERMGRQLYPTLTRLGLGFDAVINPTCVRFIVTGPSAHFARGLEILLGVMEPPFLSLEALNLERLRVQAEMREDDASDSADDFAYKQTWKGTPMARDILGTKTAVNRIGLDTLAAEHARWFSPGNFCFCATGSADMPLLRARLEALEPLSGVPAPQDVPVPPAFFHRDAAVAVDDAGYTWLRFCVDVDTARQPPLALTLMTDALRSDYGLIYRTLSEDTGLAYSYNDYFERCANIGNFYFDFEIQRERLNEAVDAVVNMLNGLKTAPDDFWEGVKAGFVALERCREASAETFNYVWLFDNGRCRCGFQSPEERLAAYLAISPDALRSLARAVFTPDNVLLCLRARKRRVNVQDLHNRLMRLKTE